MTARTKYMTRGNTSKLAWEPTVAVSVVLGFLAHATANGARREMLLDECAIDAAELENPDGRVALSRYVALIEAGEKLLDDPAIAAHVAASMAAREYSPCGLIGQLSANATDALVQLNRYARLSMDIETTDGGDPFRLEHDAEGTWLVDFRRYPRDARQLAEATLARFAVGARQHSGEIVRAAHFVQHRPAYARELERVFQCPMTFESSHNALVLDPTAFSHMRVGATSRYVSRLLRERADSLLQSLEQGRSHQGRVEATIRQRLSSDRVSMEDVARSMAMSRQTLYRRLAAEGTSFDRVLDATRQRVAIEALLERGGSVSRAAYRAGFSDPSAFSRAFKRWTGQTPRSMARSAISSADSA